jgi:tetratricopeptide (TPR) repeat protein
MRYRSETGERWFWRALCLLCFLTAAPMALAHGGLHEQIARLTRQIAKDRRNPELYLKRGELHRVHRDWSAALADYTQAAKLAPALIEVDFCRGRMLLEANRPKAAKPVLDRFLAERPDHAEALITRARALAKLAQHEAAAADYARAIALLPNPKPDYYLERAKVQTAAGSTHLDTALRGLDEGIKKLGSVAALQLAAIELELEQKRWDAALARLERLAGQSPRKEVWLQRRGQILLRAGRASEARAAFAASLRAIESLPQRLRQTKAIADLEKQVRSALESESLNAGRGDEFL